MASLRLSPKKFIAVVSAVLALYSLARVGVLFFEALAVVREGRSEDFELLQLCQRGDARGSAKMREACLRARSDIASPVVFKAIVQAVSTAFKDFSDSVGSPFKFSVVVLFIVSSVVLPIVPWCRMIFGNAVSDASMSTYGGNGCNAGVHYIAYAPPSDTRGRLRRIGSRVAKRLKMRSTPTIVEADDDRFDEIEPGFGNEKLGGATWTSVDIGHDGRPSSPMRNHAYEGHAKWD